MSTTEEFILKENTYEEEVQIDEARAVVIRVSRTRASSGQAAIFLKIGSNKRIEISNDATAYGNAYHDVASSIAELLTKAVDDPCALPKS
jgi:hypothetical protein